MANVLLSTKAVGSTVKLKVNGTAKEFIVVHQGKPSSLYDNSCDGTWLLMKDIYENRQWHSSNVNNLENSTIHSYLNGTFLNLFESNIRDAIKQVKLPYRKNGGSGGSDQSGANGLLCKIFLLSGYEIGFTTSDNSYFPVDGAKLSYFEAGTGSSALNKRIAYLNGSAAFWWLRSPGTDGASYVWFVLASGGYNRYSASSSYGIRPALILPSTLLVSDDGTVSTNTPPTITSTSGASGVNLGSKTAAFSFKYTPNDADGDKLTVTEKLDGREEDAHECHQRYAAHLRVRQHRSGVPEDPERNAHHHHRGERRQGECDLHGHLHEGRPQGDHHAEDTAGGVRRHHGGGHVGRGADPGRRGLQGRGNQQREGHQPCVAGRHRGGQERRKHRLHEQDGSKRRGVQLPHHCGARHVRRRIYLRRERRVPVRRESHGTRMEKG